MEKYIRFEFLNEYNSKNYVNICLKCHEEMTWKEIIDYILEKNFKNRKISVIGLIDFKKVKSFEQLNNMSDKEIENHIDNGYTSLIYANGMTESQMTEYIICHFKNAS